MTIGAAAQITIAITALVGVVALIVLAALVPAMGFYAAGARLARWWGWRRITARQAARCAQESASGAYTEAVAARAAAERAERAARVAAADHHQEG